MAEKRKVSVGTPVSEIWLYVTTAHVYTNSFITGVYYFVPNYQGKGGRIKCTRGKLSNYQIIKLTWRFFLQNLQLDPILQLGAKV